VAYLFSGRSAIFISSSGFVLVLAIICGVKNEGGSKSTIFFSPERCEDEDASARDKLELRWTGCNGISKSDFLPRRVLGFDDPLRPDDDFFDALRLREDRGDGDSDDGASLGCLRRPLADDRRDRDRDGDLLDDGGLECVEERLLCDRDGDLDFRDE